MKLKKNYIMVIIVLSISIFFCTPLLAADESNVITLDQAKELAGTKARSMQNLAVTGDKLKIDAKIAYSNYFGTDIQNNIDGYAARVGQLRSEMKALDPGDPGEAAQITALQAQIDQIDARVSALKAARPSTTDMSSALRLQWRALDYASQDMAKTTQDAERQLEAAVESMYFSLLNIQNMLQLQEKNLELLGMQLRVERLKKELGLGTDIEEKNVAVQYDSLIKALQEIKNTRQIMTWQLNDLLGRESTSELTLIPERFSPVLTMANYEEVLNKALENSLSISKKKREIEDYGKDARKETDSYKRSSLLHSKEIAELELEDLIQNARVTVKSLVEGMPISYNAWMNKNLAKDKAEAVYQNEQIKYDLGTISRLQLLGSETQYIQAVNEEIAATQDWHITKSKVQLLNEGIISVEK
jgi:hypothetical protein